MNGLRRFARARLKSFLQRLLALASDSGRPKMLNPEMIYGLEQVRSIHLTAILNVVPDSEKCESRIVFGRDVYVGRQVEISATAGGRIVIADDTSIQDFCLVYGDVRLGAHTMLANHVFLCSTSHQFRNNPEWLIRDQDLQFPTSPFYERDKSATIRVEEDCWLGWSAVILPGVYVGRGAIIGANCVVTKSIGPYEVHGGVPNRKISSRLSFDPPPAIDARDDSAIPYFYRGFLSSQSELRKSRELGLIEALGHACIVLAGTPSRYLVIVGRLLDDAANPSLRVRINGVECADCEVSHGDFRINVEVPQSVASASRGSVPGPLRSYTWVELNMVSDHKCAPRYGVATATLSLDLLPQGIAGQSRNGVMSQGSNS